MHQKAKVQTILIKWMKFNILQYMQKMKHKNNFQIYFSSFYI